jgi:hypothetical protein
MQGLLTILYKGKAMPYAIYHQQAKQSEVVSAKDVGPLSKCGLTPSPHLITLGTSIHWLLWRMGDILTLG